eukprot:COSAG02_NODE_5538_length_4245_cov_120.115533_2_plen_93_part_00
MQAVLRASRATQPLPPSHSRLVQQATRQLPRIWLKPVALALATGSGGSRHWQVPDVYAEGYCTRSTIIVQCGYEYVHGCNPGTRYSTYNSTQ